MWRIFIPSTYCVTFVLIVVHGNSPEFNSPHLSTRLLYSSPGTVLDACLGVDIAFQCEFSEEQKDEIIEGKAFIMADDKPIFRSEFQETNTTLSVTFNATKLNVTHPVSNFTCGTKIRVSSSSDIEVWASKSNVVKIKFHECLEQQRRTRRILVGKTVKLVCPFHHSRPVDWDLDGYPLNRSDDKYRLNANGSSLTINNLIQQDSGVYRCFQKFHPLSLTANSMSHDLTVLSTAKRIPDELILLEATEKSLHFTWTIELENRAGVKRFVQHSEPFSVCYASLNDEVVKNMTVSTRAVSVRIHSVSSGAIFAVQSIARSEQCFQRQDNVQFFATLASGERWETDRMKQLARRDATSIDFKAEQTATLYCGANLQYLKGKNFTITWYHQGETRIVHKTKGRRKIDPRTSAMVFEKVYAVDSAAYRCHIRFHGGPGLIKGEHVTDQWVYLTHNATSSEQNHDSSTAFCPADQFKCSNSTENSISIKWRSESMGEHEWREEGSRPIESTPNCTLTVLYWETDGMGDINAPDVLVANLTTKLNEFVLENLNTDALYTIYIMDGDGDAEGLRSLLKCWTDPIQDTLEVPV